MSPAVTSDIRRLLTILGFAALAGWLGGHLLAGLLAGVLVLLAWYGYELVQTYRWLNGHDASLPRQRGLLGEVLSQTERTQRQARKRKKRLRKVVERFQQASEANPDGSLILDSDDRIEWINRAASRMLGLRQGQDHGQPIGNLMRHPDFTEWLERRDTVEPYELDSPVTSGQRLLLRQVPYGNSRRMLIVRDITRLHVLEQMRRDFVANVSHELRSPLTVVMGYLEGMNDDPDLPEHYRRPVARMFEQSARMERIVEDLLRLSRIESDPGGAARSPIAIADLIEAVLRDAARLHQVDHEVSVAVAERSALLGDFNEIYSAFSNLVFNAFRYTPAGGAIAIGWEVDEDGNGMFVVRDSGVGIEAHHIPRLTERFYRVDKARSRELGGTGLGLAIAKHVLMRHDGKLEIESEPGQGSTFRCHFPADRVAAPADADAPRALASAVAGRAEG